ncbi:MAG: hypothetical protein AAGD35_14390 [Actinomycetota bacterium]
MADSFVLLTALAAAFEIDLEQAVLSKFFEADGRRGWATAENAPDA